MTKIEKIKKIVDECTAAKVEGMLLDLFTAGKIVAVYNSISETNKAHYVSLPIEKMAVVAYKLTA